MLLGENELTINQATMIAALQMYLNTTFAEGKSPKVTDVKLASGKSYGNAGTEYVVSVTSAIDKI